jgi:hypothetical protein
VPKTTFNRVRESPDRSCVPVFISWQRPGIMPGHQVPLSNRKATEGLCCGARSFASTLANGMALAECARTNSSLGNSFAFGFEETVEVIVHRIRLFHTCLDISEGHFHVLGVVHRHSLRISCTLIVVGLFAVESIIRFLFARRVVRSFPRRPWLLVFLRVTRCIFDVHRWPVLGTGSCGVFLILLMPVWAGGASVGCICLTGCAA